MAEEQTEFTDLTVTEEPATTEQDVEDAPVFEEENLRKIYLGGIKRTTTKEQIQEQFETFGGIATIAIAMDNDKKSKGFAFITMNTIAETDKVLHEHETDPLSLDGKKIEVRRAIPRTSNITSDMIKKIFVAGLNKGSINEDDLREYFGKLGTVNDVAIAMDKNTNQSKGFAFIEMEYYYQVDKVALMATHVINGCTVDVNKAHGVSKKTNFPRGGYGGGGDGRRGGSSYGGGGGYSSYGRDSGNGYSSYDRDSYSRDSYSRYDGYSGGYDGYYSGGSSSFGPQRGGYDGRGRGRGGYRPY